MQFYKKLFIITCLFASTATLFGYEDCGKDIILEFKAAYFRPTDCLFRNIYGSSGALFGPEVTFKLWRGLFGFVSADYFTKHGRSIGQRMSTRVDMLPIGIGLKYMGRVCDHATLYAGLGVEPTYLHTKDRSQFVICKRTFWGCGGIAKFGTYIDLPCNFVLDLFVDYSFVKVSPACCTQNSTLYIQQRRADLSGLVVGGGIGYRFD